MNYKFLLSLICALALFSCKDNNSKSNVPQEDTKAKQMLQGIWINEESQSVVFRVKGDSVFYPDSTIQPVSFQIFKDTFVLHGANDVKYPIQKQTPHLFIFHNQNGDEVKLTLSNDAEDETLFSDRHPRALNQNQLIKRDTVVLYGDERYHCYVQVNPTSYKVAKSTYNDEGVEVYNFYYDNIVNLHIFHVNRKIFSSDFHKSDFKSIVPQKFLEQAVFSDLVFRAIDAEGVHYVASLVIPDSMSSFEVEVIVSFDGKLRMSVL
ncbi:MAG: DUF4738 domain-containing protein [Prevotella sp.]|jgi:hypothetical protein